MTDETTNPMREAIQSAIDENPVILFMKGTPTRPPAASPPARWRSCSR